jgi:hypothetical protein
MGREVQRGAERGAERCEITQIRTHKKSTHNTYIANLTEITDSFKLHRKACLFSILQAVRGQSLSSPHVIATL